MSVRPLQHLCLKAVVESPLWPFLVKRNMQRAVKTYWLYKMRRPLDLDNTQTLNEKIQWLKLHGNTALWTDYADKLKVKQLLAEQGFAQYLTPTLGVWTSADDIDINSLPDRFVLKCTHDCGSTIVVNDKNTADWRKIRRQLNRHLRRTYGYHAIEPHYFNIPPHIIAEQTIGSPEYYQRHHSLNDYKFWCFDGHAELCFVCYNRATGSQQHHSMKDLYTAHGFTPLREGLIEKVRPIGDPLPKPENYDEMVALAERLSIGHPQVRVDLYNVDGKIYFGELTFTSYGGIMRNFTVDMQHRLGSLTKLRAL